MIQNYSQFFESKSKTLLEKAREFAGFSRLVNDKIDDISPDDKYVSGLTVFRSGASPYIFDVRINNGERLIFDADYMINKMVEEHVNSIKDVIEVLDSSSFGIFIQYRIFKGDKHVSSTRSVAILKAVYTRKDDIFVFDRIEADPKQISEDQYSIRQAFSENKELASILKWSKYTPTDCTDKFIEKWNDDLNGIIPFDVSSLERKLKGTSFDVHDIRIKLANRKYGI